MTNWIIEDFLKDILPKAILGGAALAAAHSQWLAAHGIHIDWTTFGGWLSSVAVTGVGVALAHHGVTKPLQSN